MYFQQIQNYSRQPSNTHAVIRPSLEYGSEVWESNKGQTNALESQSSPGGLEGATGVEGQRDGKFREGKLHCVCYASCVEECINERECVA